MTLEADIGQKSPTNTRSLIALCVGLHLNMVRVL